MEFRCRRDEWVGSHRIVHEALLDAVAVVARPAYAGAVINSAGEMRCEDFFELRSPKKEPIKWRSL